VDTTTTTRRVFPIVGPIAKVSLACKALSQQLDRARTTAAAAGQGHLLTPDLILLSALAHRLLLAMERAELVGPRTYRERAAELDEQLGDGLGISQAELLQEWRAIGSPS
jgi:hypothetical protein